jgi:protein-tyrosine phosphatase
VDQIGDRLWLGASEDCAILGGVSIAAVLTLCETAPTMPDGVLHLHWPIPDEVFLPPDLWGRLIGQLAVILAGGHRTLVHCRLGVSRAPTLVAGYLLQTGEVLTPAEALTVLRGSRACVNPHPATWAGMVAWWRENEQDGGD